MHERGTDDHTVGVFANRRALLGRGHANAHAHIRGACLAGALDEPLRRLVKLRALAGHTHAGGRIHEASRIAGDEAQAFVRGFRRDEEHTVETIAVGCFDPLACFIGNQVGGDEARSACVGEVTGEAQHAVMEDEVPVAHDQRDRSGIGDGLHGVEHAGDLLPCAQSREARLLNDGAVHDGIGVGQADFDDVHAGVDEGAERVER